MKGFALTLFGLLLLPIAAIAVIVFYKRKPAATAQGFTPPNPVLSNALPVLTVPSQQGNAPQTPGTIQQIAQATGVASAAAGAAGEVASVLGSLGTTGAAEAATGATVTATTATATASTTAAAAGGAAEVGTATAGGAGEAAGAGALGVAAPIAIGVGDAAVLAFAIYSDIHCGDQCRAWRAEQQAEYFFNPSVVTLKNPYTGDMESFGGYTGKPPIEVETGLQMQNGQLVQVVPPLPQGRVNTSGGTRVNTKY